MCCYCLQNQRISMASFNFCCYCFPGETPTLIPNNSRIIDCNSLEVHSHKIPASFCFAGECLARHAWNLMEFGAWTRQKDLLILCCCKVSTQKTIPPSDLHVKSRIGPVPCESAIRCIRKITQHSQKLPFECPL